MEIKDLIAIIGIAVTFAVSAANLAYSLWNNKRTSFVNTVTASRLKWIDSLRDKVCEFIAVTNRIVDPSPLADEKSVSGLLLQRDTLLHEIVLHLKPHDPQDGKIRTLVNHVQELTDARKASPELSDSLLELRDATGEYLKKEWNRVKKESTGKRRFGGVEDMHLLKGYSSIDDLVSALRSFEAKLRGKPVVVDARNFFYSRINMAMGEDVVLEVLDAAGNWQFVNEACARLLEKPVEWFAGKNLFVEFPELIPDWRDILETVVRTRETYIDRTYRGLLNLPRKGEEWVWNVLAFPMTLHNNQPGVVLTARILERKS